GGDVTFDISNDAPTMAGAQATFSIALRFPGNQTVLPDGRVVWSQNCTVNGTRVTQGDPVFPEQPDATGAFPDGRPLPRGKRGKFVYVWWTWGRYWQVVDGAASQLTVGTAGVPLGSYTMEVAVYHYRGRQKFIPIGHASTQFSITAWMAAATTAAPRPLSPSTLTPPPVPPVSPPCPLRVPPVSPQTRSRSPWTCRSCRTRWRATGASCGTAPWPSPCGCTTPAATCATPTCPTRGTSGTRAGPSSRAAPPSPTPTWTPAPSRLACTVAGTSTGEGGRGWPRTAWGECSWCTPPAPSHGVCDRCLLTPQCPTHPIEPPAPRGVSSVSPSPHRATHPMGCVPSVPLTPQSHPPHGVSATSGATAGSAIDATAAATLGITAGATAASLTAATAGNTPGATAGSATAGTTAQPLALVKRQAPAENFPGCVLYRYGTFATQLDIVQGIESVAIVQVAPEGSGSSVELTVTCEGG
ncbi:PMEL protein, partial [Eulacestoma nigropectus]|nr:PMEL protein [Eulacestoma nigropectus]